jgi:molybdate transport system substrate-binding protein
VPEAWHSPLRQRAVVLRGAGAGARGFFDFLQGAEARRILARHGFRLPAP